jgi:hypothetical protein
MKNTMDTRQQVLSLGVLTDGHGGAAYNQDLSNRYARALVADVVTHYGIASTRSAAIGFGLTPLSPTQRIVTRCSNVAPSWLASRKDGNTCIPGCYVYAASH